MGRRIGTRYPHLIRRGNVFYVRFRIPKALVPKLGMGELCRSLRTSDLAIAKSRAKDAALWFTETIAILENMSNATRQQLEQATRLYFADLCREADQPRDLTSDPSSPELAWQIEHSQAEIDQIDDFLKDRAFEIEQPPIALQELEAHLGRPIADGERVLAFELVKRAQRQRLRYFVHGLTEPTKRFAPDDEVFIQQLEQTALAGLNVGNSQATASLPSLTLQEARLLFINYATEVLGHSKNPLGEAARVLVWLEEEFGSERQVSTITKDELRGFRDGLLRLTKSQGKASRFRDRLNNPDGVILHNATRTKYWQSIRNFFKFLLSEHDIEDPSSELEFRTGKQMKSRETEPFSDGEIEMLLSIPLFAGALSPRSLYREGSYVGRRGKWWSGVLLLTYGMRGGECAQLLPSDFDFDAAIPHFKIQPGMLPEGFPKSHKNPNMTLALPIPEALLKLGLKEFVAARSKKKTRLLFEIPVLQGKPGNGIAKLWRYQFMRFGLHSEGRGSHGFRHTVAGQLRAVGAKDDEISLIQGRKPQTISGNYGVTQQLERKLEIIERLPYMQWLVERLGGPYDPKKH